MKSETAWLVKWGALAWGIGVLGGVGVAVGCGGRLLDEPPARVDALGGGVDPGPGDGYALQEAHVEGDTLHVTLQHAGGCAEHAFRWHWSGQWLEASPVRTQLVLHRASYRVEHSTVVLQLRGTETAVPYVF